MLSSVFLLSLVEHIELMIVGVVELSRAYCFDGAKVSSLVPFPNLVEHIKLMFVSAVELCRTC